MDEKEIIKNIIGLKESIANNNAEQMQKILQKVMNNITIPAWDVANTKNNNKDVLDESIINILLQLLDSIIKYNDFNKLVDSKIGDPIDTLNMLPDIKENEQIYEKIEMLYSSVSEYRTLIEKIISTILGEKNIYSSICNSIYPEYKCNKQYGEYRFADKLKKHG